MKTKSYKKISLVSTLRTTVFLLFLMISTLFAGTAVAEAQVEPEVLLNEVHQLYSDRFNLNGQYLNDSVKKEKFKKRQLEVIQILRAGGYIGDTFLINNTAKADLSIRVSIVKSKSEKLLGLLVERSVYDSTTEAFLRLFSRPVLEGGMDLLRFSEGSVIHIQKALGQTDAPVWSLVVKYPLDFNAKNFATISMRILPSTLQGRHAFVNEQNFSFSRITLDLWFKIFSGNFGISNFKFE